jgi:hypothetical protein
MLAVEKVNDAFVRAPRGVFFMEVAGAFGKKRSSY